MNTSMFMRLEKHLGTLRKTNFTRGLALLAAVAKTAANIRLHVRSFATRRGKGRRKRYAASRGGRIFANGRVRTQGRGHSARDCGGEYQRVFCVLLHAAHYTIFDWLCV